MNVSELEFPVLSIASNGFVSTAADRDALEGCSKWGLRKGYYDSLILIDARGDVFRVVQATERSTKPLWMRVLSRHTFVELTIQPSGHLTLEEEKDRVCAAMGKLPDQWEAVEDLASAQAKARRAPSVRQLHELFLQE